MAWDRAREAVERRKVEHRPIALPYYRPARRSCLGSRLVRSRYIRSSRLHQRRAGHTKPLLHEPSPLRKAHIPLSRGEALDCRPVASKEAAPDASRPRSARTILSRGTRYSVEHPLGPARDGPSARSYDSGPTQSRAPVPATLEGQLALSTVERRADEAAQLGVTQVQTGGRALEHELHCLGQRAAASSMRPLRRSRSWSWPARLLRPEPSPRAKDATRLPVLEL